MYKLHPIEILRGKQPQPTDAKTHWLLLGSTFWKEIKCCIILNDNFQYNKNTVHFYIATQGSQRALQILMSMSSGEVVSSFYIRGKWIKEKVGGLLCITEYIHGISKHRIHIPWLLGLCLSPKPILHLSNSWKVQAELLQLPMRHLYLHL